MPQTARRAHFKIRSAYGLQVGSRVVLGTLGAMGGTGRPRDNRALLFKRLEYFQQLGVDEFIAADDVAGFERVVVAPIPLKMPPASRTMICPAAMSHGCRLRSQ